MLKSIAVLAGVAMLSLGATAASAQTGRGSEPRPAERSGRGEGRRDGGRGTGQGRVWVEDFEMVDEQYKEDGHFEMRERKVWIEEQKVTVHEHFMVPEQKVIVTERVLIPETKILVDKVVHVEGQWVEYKETMHFASGQCFTFNRIKYVWEHDEVRQVEKCIPAHYENVQVEKCIPAHEECRDIVKCIPGHFETVCEKVFIEGCMKTRQVKKCIGGHFEVRTRR